MRSGHLARPRRLSQWPGRNKGGGGGGHFLVAAGRAAANQMAGLAQRLRQSSKFKWFDPGCRPRHNSIRHQPGAPFQSGRLCRLARARNLAARKTNCASERAKARQGPRAAGPLTGQPASRQPEPRLPTQPEPIRLVYNVCARQHRCRRRRATSALAGKGAGEGGEGELGARARTSLDSGRPIQL